MLQNKIDPWKGHRAESTHSRDSGSKGQVAGSSGSAHAPRHARSAQAPADGPGPASISPNVSVSVEEERSGARNEGNNGGKVLPHVDVPGRQTRRSPSASQTPTPAATSSRAPPRTGGVASVSPAASLKPSLKAGISRTVRATGRPADIEALAVHSGGVANRASHAASAPQRSPSPDLMPRAAKASITAPISPVSSLPVLPKLSMSSVTGTDAAMAATSITGASAPTRGASGSGSRSGSRGGSRGSVGRVGGGSRTSASAIATVTVTATGTTTGGGANASRPSAAATTTSGGPEAPGQRPAVLNTLQALREEAAGLLSAAGALAPGAGAGAGDRVAGSAPAFSGGGRQAPNSPSPSRLALPFLGGVGSNSMRASRGGLPFLPLFMMPASGTSSNPASPLRGAHPFLGHGGKNGRSPGRGRPRRPKRVAGQQQGSARLNLSSKTGRRIPDPTGSFEVITTAPGVIGEVQFSQEVWCMDLWKVLEGGCNQQRIWTFGTPAISNAAAAAAQIMAASGVMQTTAAPGGANGAAGGASGDGGGLGASAAAADGYTSAQPLALLNGVVFRAVAAGSHHAAAISSEGFLYLWGSDSRGQLGRGWPSTQHIAGHTLPREVQPPIEASLEDLQGALPVSLVQGIIASSTPRQQSSRRLMVLDDGGDSGGVGGGGGGEEAVGSAVGAEAASGASGSVGGGSGGTAGAMHLFPMPSVHSPGGGSASRSRLHSAASSYSSYRQQSDNRVLAAAASSVTAGLAIPGAATAAIMAAAAAAASAEGTSIGAALGPGPTPSVDPDGDPDDLGSPVGGSRRFNGPGEQPQQLHMYRLKMGVPVRVVACGALHTLAALDGGGVMGWGDNGSGQATGKPGVPAVRINTPTRIPEFEQTEVVCLSAGLQHSAAVTTSGSVWTWGSNRHGRLGTGLAVPVSIVDTLVTTPGRTSSHNDRDHFPNTAAMLAHAHHSPMGLHDDVQLGLTFLPTRAKFPAGVVVCRVACGYRHTLALDSEGGVWGWGSNATQSLGLADFVDRPAPVRVPGLPPCSAVSAATVSAAISMEGHLYLWGSDSYLNPWVHRNRVGGPQGAAMTPRSASLPLIHRVRWLGALRFRSVSVGARHATAVSSYGQMYWWGDEDMLPASMQYGSSRIMAKPPEPQDFLPIPRTEHIGDGSVPPPPPPPNDPRSPTSYFSGSSALPNRLSAFRVFTYRPVGRFSDGGSRSAALDSTVVSFSGGVATSPLPHESHSGSSFNGYLGLGGGPGRDEHDRYGLVVRLCVFNDRIYVSIRPRRPPPLILGSAGGMSYASRPTSVLGGRLTDGGSVAAMPMGTGAPGAVGSVGARSATPAGSAVGTTSIWNGDEQPVLVACGEGHTVCLCGQTRHQTTLDETRNAMMLMLRQYARHWHAVRRTAQARLLGGSPVRVRSRSPERRPSSGRSTRSVFGVNRAQLPLLQDVCKDPFPYIELDERPTDPRDELCTLDMVLVFCRQAGLIDNISEYNDVIELYRIQLTNKHARIPPSLKHAVELIGRDFSNNPTG
ncbi:hypothetical protein VaNZ11_007176, partial [Volvox africanus]